MRKINIILPAGMIYGWLALAESPGPAPRPSPAIKETTAPAQATHTLVDSLSPADVQEAIDLLKANYVNPTALSEQELARATLEGLMMRLAPGASVLESGTGAQASAYPLHTEILDDRIGYVRLGAISKAAAVEMDAALKNFTDKSIKSVILDLRDTLPDGDFDAAQEIMQRFCPQGKLLFTIKKPGAKQERMFTSSQAPQFQGIVVMLVDRETAGAAEVLAAVLREQVNALLIGETTCGAAVEYADLALHNGRILRVAEARVNLPGGADIFPKGLQPDLVVKLPLEVKHQIMQQSLEKGISQFVFEKERPRMNEAALVAGRNPELDALEATQAKKQEAKSVPPRDTVMQRAVDFITTMGVYGAAPATEK